MGKISEFTAHDYEVIARDYADLKEAARKRCNSKYELEQIQKAFEFANEAHKGIRRPLNLPMKLTRVSEDAPASHIYFIRLLSQR